MKNTPRKSLPLKLGRMIIHEFIAEGGFGKIYRVSFPPDSEEAALKVMRKRKFRSMDSYTPVINEARVLATVKYPSIAALHDCFQTHGYVCLVLDFVDAPDLFTIITTYGVSLEMPVVKCISAQLVLTLRYLHENRIIYRDLKGENILLYRDCRIKLVDFGFAKKLDLQGRTSTFCGTPGYMAPEINGITFYTYAVDWFALGVLIFIMIALDFPFGGLSQPNGLNEAYSSEHIRFTEAFSPDARELIRLLLKRDATERLGIIQTPIESLPWFAKIEWANLSIGKTDIQSAYLQDLHAKILAKRRKHARSDQALRQTKVQIFAATRNVHDVQIGHFQFIEPLPT